MKTSTPPRLSITARSVLIAALSLSLLPGCRPSEKGTARYETTSVSRGDLVQHVTASGTLSAVVSVDVGCRISGQVDALHVDFNSPVKKGQLIAEIDPTVYEAALKQAEGDLASAQADTRLKRQSLDRKKTLAPIKAASQQDLDEATAELARAEATVTIREAAVDSAKANLGYCKITAPVDGIVISRSVDKGQTVNAALNTPILFTIAQDISQMNIKADVSEADIGQVKMDQPVDFTVDAFPNDIFHGTVNQVRKSSTATQNVVTYQVIISVGNPDEKLFPGMTADVSILVAQQNDVLKVPNTALRFTPPDDAKYEQAAAADGKAVSENEPAKVPKLARNERLVYTTGPDGTKLKPIVVKSGINDGVETEILEGVNEGTAIVTSTVSTGKPAGGGFGGPPPQAPQ